jgi:transcriptional regulator with XRE-family HTH domain
MSQDALEKKSRIKPGRARYKSVSSMLQQDGTSDDTVVAVEQLARDSRITRQLASWRTSVGITQEQMAEKMNCTQGCISKKEAGLDDELDLATLKAYSHHLGKDICLQIGRPQNHVQTIKQHAFGIRDSMRELAKLAHKDDELEQEIQAFFAEAMINVVSLLAQCQSEMPHPQEIQVIMNDQSNENCLPTPVRSIKSTRELATA